MNTIVIKSIPHNEQDYETCGNYKEEKFDNDQKICQIFVSKLPNWRMEFLIAVHELIEYGLVKHNKIPLEKIDDFDIEFEKKRQEGNFDEPGDDKNAPYYLQHQFATQIEKMLASEMGIDWYKYNGIINKL